MQRAGDVGRRNHDAERVPLRLRPGSGCECIRLRPAGRNFRLNSRGVIGFFEHDRGTVRICGNRTVIKRNRLAVSTRAAKPVALCCRRNTPLHLTIRRRQTHCDPSARPDRRAYPMRRKMSQIFGPGLTSIRMSISPVSGDYRAIPARFLPGQAARPGSADCHRATASASAAAFLRQSRRRTVAGRPRSLHRVR
jgi:hypothetical protein